MTIFTYEDIVKIAQFLHDNGYDGYNITIENKVKNKEAIKKVNEEFFYRANPDTKETPEECDSVNINIKSSFLKFFKNHFGWQCSLQLNYTITEFA